MKPASVLIDLSVYPTGTKMTTSTLTAEEHEPELLPDGWVRFKAYGEWHRIPPWAVKRVTEHREVDINIEKSIKTVEVPYLVSKRGNKPKS